MKKFFLFRREQITLLSTTSSNDGAGLSVIALPADKISFITATLGKVHFNFDDASVYDYVNVPESDVIDKTHVVVSCKKGKEIDLMESAMNFLSAEDKRNILRFDSVNKEATLKDSKVDGFEDISSILNSTPINIITQETDPTEHTISGIDFLSSQNIPDIDYNEDNLPLGSGQHISSWPNDSSALGGSGYDMTDEGASNTLTQSGGGTSFVSTMSAHVQASNYFELAEAYQSLDTYTMYCAFGFPAYTNMYEIFGSADGTAKGFSDGRSSLFTMIHDSLIGLPASSKTDNKEQSTIEYEFPDRGLEVNAREYQSLYSFVIRRDKDYNLYLYNFRGDVVAVLPAKTGGSLNTNSRTDGALEIKTIGGVSSDYLWKGFLCRFGVISRDVGHNLSRQIAKDLYKKYAQNYSTFN
jgi:hypothetical protein